MKLTPFVAVALMSVCGCSSTPEEIREEKFEKQQYSSFSSDELKLRLAQLDRKWSMDRREQQNGIEFELLKRWKAGDKSAYLPQFTNPTTTAPKKEQD